MEKPTQSPDGWKPTILMVLAQIIFAGINVCYKLAAHAGMDLRLVVAYRFLFGAVVIVPYAFFSERKKRPKLTWTVVFQAFCSGLFGGTLGQNLYLESLVMTSATFAAAMTNLIPGVTFILAVCLRMERLGLGTKAGSAKILGTLLGIAGAMVFTFYKGVEIVPWKTDVNLLKLIDHHGTKTKTQSQNFVLGIILALLSCLSYSSWLIVQARAIAVYRCPESFTAMMVMMAAVQSTIFGLCVQRDWSQWKLGWNVRLLTVAYAGIVGSGVMFCLVAVCVRMRGPLFVSIFNPLLLILVAIIGSLVLDERLHLGSILGSILIIFGLYAVLWGKSKEAKKMKEQLIAEKPINGDENGAQTGQIEIIVPSSTQK